MYVMNCKYSERGQINATNDCNTASANYFARTYTSRPEWHPGCKHQF